MNYLSQKVEMFGIFFIYNCCRVVWHQSWFQCARNVHASQLNGEGEQWTLSTSVMGEKTLNLADSIAGASLFACKPVNPSA